MQEVLVNMGDSSRRESHKAILFKHPASWCEPNPLSYFFSLLEREGGRETHKKLKGEALAREQQSLTPISGTNPSGRVQAGGAKHQTTGLGKQG